MRISKLAIKRGVTFTMVYLIAVGFGIYGLSDLKLDLYPDITLPIIGVITDYKGVGPEDIENTITRPLEKTVVSVENLKNIISLSKSGSSTLILEFEWGTDMDQAEIDVRKMIDLVRDYLPAEASEPMSFAFDPSMMPIIYMTLSSDKLGMAELRKLAQDKIGPKLERLSGVASAVTSGGIERQIKVLVNPRQLAAHGISIQSIIQKLGMENLQIPGGIVDDEYKEYTVRTYGEYTNVDQIKNTVVGVENGSPIYVKNVANVIDGYRDQTQVVRNNGENAILILIQKQSDANTIDVAEKVKNEIPKIESELGNGIKFEFIMDQSKFIKKSLNNLTNTAIQAFILAFFVVFFFLRSFKSSLITAISIPVSIVITFFIMNQMGLTLNIISMAGLALAIGMLIDNSIVVLENIFRHKESGEDIRTAADEGTTEVGVAITASTLTTLAIFIPILFVKGITGVMFKDMVVSIVCSLSISLIVALTLIPLLSSRFLEKGKKRVKIKLIRKIDQGIGNFITNIEDKYVKVLDYFLSHKKLFISFIVLLIILTGLIFKSVGGEFLPKTDQSNISINIERETGASLTTTDRSFREVEKIISETVPEAENIESSFGVGEGFAASFGGGSNKGSINISLPDVKDRKRSAFEIESELRKKLSKIPGTKITMSQGHMMMGQSGDIEIKVFGYDRKIATSLGNKIEEQLKNIDGVVDITKSYSLPKPEYQIRLDRDRISALGLSVYQVATTIEASLKGKIATKFRESGDEYDVIVQLDESFRQSKFDLDNIYISSMTGAQIPLKNVAEIVKGEAAEKIDRENQERNITVSCSVAGLSLIHI